MISAASVNRSSLEHMFSKHIYYRLRPFNSLDNVLRCLITIYRDICELSDCTYEDVHAFNTPSELRIAPDRK